MKRLEQYDVFDIPCERVFYDETFNCRGAFTMQSVADLAEAIRERGLLFPVVVQPICDMPESQRPAGYDWRMLAGHRRYTAVTTFLKWPTIPASVRSGLTEEQARMLNFLENVERKDLNILEEARWLKHNFPEKTPLRVIAAAVKKDTRWVHVRLRLLTLCDEIQQQAAAGILTRLDIEVLAEIPDAAKQLEAAREIVNARAKGKSLRKMGVPHIRRFRNVRSKKDISRMVARMLDVGITGLAPRFGAWCAGYISDDELEADITAEVFAWQSG